MNRVKTSMPDGHCIGLYGNLTVDFFCLLTKHLYLQGAYTN